MDLARQILPLFEEADKHHMQIKISYPQVECKQIQENEIIHLFVRDASKLTSPVLRISYDHTVSPLLPRWAYSLVDDNGRSFNPKTLGSLYVRMQQLQNRLYEMNLSRACVTDCVGVYCNWIEASATED